jgi:hypothetical protein
MRERPARKEERPWLQHPDVSPPRQTPRPSLGSCRPRTGPTAYDLDSMDVLNFMIALHASLGVDVPESDYVTLASLNSAVDYLADRLKS